MRRLIMVGGIALIVLSGCGSSASTSVRGTASAPSASPTPRYVATPSPEPLAVTPAKWPTTEEAVAAFSQQGYRFENHKDLWICSDPESGTSLDFNGFSGLYVTSADVYSHAVSPASDPAFGALVAVFAPGAADWMNRWLSQPAAARTARASVLVPVAGSTPIEGRHLPPAALLACFTSGNQTVCFVEPT